MVRRPEMRVRCLILLMGFFVTGCSGQSGQPPPSAAPNKAGSPLVGIANSGVSAPPDGGSCGEKVYSALRGPEFPRVEYVAVATSWQVRADPAQAAEARIRVAQAIMDGGHWGRVEGGSVPGLQVVARLSETDHTIDWERDCSAGTTEQSVARVLKAHGVKYLFLGELGKEWSVAVPEPDAKAARETIEKALKAERLYAVLVAD